MKVEQKCGIISRTMLNDAAISLTLEAGDMVRTAFRAPGQFVHIKCGHSRLLRRPISVCSCQAGEGDAPDRLTVVFEVRGEGTAWLAGRREGQSLDVMGLLGNGFPMKREGRYLLVGGGIGVPPMVEVAKHYGENATAVCPRAVHRHPGVPLRGQGDAGGAVPLRVLPGAGGHR